MAQSSHGFSNIDHAKAEVPSHGSRVIDANLSRHVLSKSEVQRPRYPERLQRPLVRPSFDMDAAPADVEKASGLRSNSSGDSEGRVLRS